MSDVKGKRENAPMVRFERLLAAPIERVWDHLTRTELLTQWYGNGNIEPRSGGQVSLMDGHIRGTVTQCHPPNKLIYTWNVFDPGEAVSSYPESYLTLELKEEDDRVRLTLTHLPILDTRFLNQTMMGWHTFLDLIEAGLSGGDIPPRQELSRKNAALYGVDLEKLHS